MITTTFTNSRPMPFTVLAQEAYAVAVDLPVIINKGNYCWCSKVCPPALEVYAGENDLQTDKTSLIYRAISDADTVVMVLWKAGVELDTLNDATYGTYYTGTNASGQIYFGYLVDWGLVFDAFGAGEYVIKTAATILSQPFTYTSEIYRLYPYNERVADGTVRIEVVQNGYTESSDLNFTGMSWYSQMRLQGQFGNRQPEFTKSGVQDTTRTFRQIQSSIRDTWELELYDLSDAQKDSVVYNDLLGNSITITDYSLGNAHRYEPILVTPESIDNLTYHDPEPGANLVLKFATAKENIIKRNIYF